MGISQCLVGFGLGALAGALLVLVLKRRGTPCVVAAVQHERWRIARELHDTVGHRLVVISMQVRALRSDTSRPELIAQAVEDEARAAQRDIRRTIGVLRRVGSKALSASLTDLTARLPGGEVSICLDNVGNERNVRPELREAALRIVQEGVTNALKHGVGPIRVAVNFGDTLDIEVANGTAGPPPAERARGGYGLLGLRERIAAFDGALECGPVPGGGFVVRARIPTGGSGSRATRKEPTWAELEY